MKEPWKRLTMCGRTCRQFRSLHSPAKSGKSLSRRLRGLRGWVARLQLPRNPRNPRPKMCPLADLREDSRFRFSFPYRITDDNRWRACREAGHFGNHFAVVAILNGPNAAVPIDEYQNFCFHG